MKAPARREERPALEAVGAAPRYPAIPVAGSRRRYLLSERRGRTTPPLPQHRFLPPHLRPPCARTLPPPSQRMRSAPTNAPPHHPPPPTGPRGEMTPRLPRVSRVRSHPVGEVRAEAAILGGRAGRGAGLRRRWGGSECGLRAGGPHGRAVRLRGPGELVLGAAEPGRGGVVAAGAAPRDLPGARFGHHPRRLRALGVRELPRLALHRQQPGAGGRPAGRRRGPWGPG